MNAGNITGKCPACNATVNTRCWTHCIACNAPLSPPLEVLLAKAVQGTKLTQEYFQAQLSADDIEGIQRGEVDLEQLQVAARSMSRWR
jgi:uncharacterized metal-binding protein YceD (DUF177 family)